VFIFFILYIHFVHPYCGHLYVFCNLIKHKNFIIILYYGAGYVDMLLFLMVAGYTIKYEHIITQQLISDAIASPICM
jgi:hypothetical protein